MKIIRNIPINKVCELTSHAIGSETVKDYFSPSHEEKDFRWTTVSLIDNALTVICGDCVGLPPVFIPNCPATSSDVQSKLSEYKNKIKETEDECEELKKSIAENEDKYVERMNAIRNDHQLSIDWLKADVKLWRKIAFCLLSVLVLAIATLIFCLVTCHY